jgi:peptidoglycan/LPS O-acetylase OafA/YrhL
MVMNFVFLFLFMVPIAALCWRLVVSKTRTHWIRIGAAGAAMATAVGALVVFDDLNDFSFENWRSDIALAASMTGSVYLLGWSQRSHGNRRHRTVSIIAAILGLVPVIGAVLTGLLFGGLGS